MDLGLKDKVIVCLSSAAGIGRGIAKELAREGAKVVITTAEPYKADLEAAVEEIEKETGNRPYTYLSDIKDPDSLVRLIDNAAKDLEAAQADYDAAQEDLKAALANCDAVQTTAFANLDEDADAVLAALAEDPDSWDQLVEEKNEDPGMQAGAVNAENGYAIFEGMADFDSAFVEAGMALQSAGDISDKVRGESYGYYILKYVGDDAEGPVDYESVKDAIHDTLLSAKQDEVYTQTVQDWIAAAGIKEDLSALND